MKKFFLTSLFLGIMSFSGNFSSSYASKNKEITEEMTKIIHSTKTLLQDIEKDMQVQIDNHGKSIKAINANIEKNKQKKEILQHLRSALSQETEGGKKLHFILNFVENAKQEIIRNEAGAGFDNLINTLSFVIGELEQIKKNLNPYYIQRIESIVKNFEKFSNKQKSLEVKLSEEALSTDVLSKMKNRSKNNPSIKKEKLLEKSPISPIHSNSDDSLLDDLSENDFNMQPVYSKEKSEVLEKNSKIPSKEKQKKETVFERLSKNIVANKDSKEHAEKIAKVKRLREERKLALEAAKAEDLANKKAKADEVRAESARLKQEARAKKELDLAQKRQNVADRRQGRK